ncbi:hypothetical protein B0H14DRAFT_3067498, partial [Mycena olivaceomarginata]
VRHLPLAALPHLIFDGALINLSLGTRKAPKGVFGITGTQTLSPIAQSDFANNAEQLPSPGYPVDTSPAGIWRNITDLELRSCTFLSDGSLFSWLFNFPHLERLTISNHINQHGETEPTPFAWISMHRGNCLIEHLCVEWDWGERKLELMSQYDLRLDDIESVSFAPCPLLSSLSLSYPAGSEWHALAVLRRLNPPSYIEELVISIDLEAITSILLSPSYRSLRTLGLKLVGKPHDGNYEKAVNHLERCSVTLRGLGVDVSFDCYMWDPLLKHAVFEKPGELNFKCVFSCFRAYNFYSYSVRPSPAYKPLAVILRVHRFVLMSSLSLCSDLSNLTVKPTFECCSETSGMYCCGFFFRGCRTRPNSYDVIQTALPGPRAVSNSTPTPAPPGSLLEFLKDIMGFDFSKHLPLMTARGLADIAILRTMAEWEEKPLRHTLQRLLTGSKQELGGRKGLTELELASLEYEIRKLK